MISGVHITTNRIRRSALPTAAVAANTCACQDAPQKETAALEEASGPKNNLRFLPSQSLLAPVQSKSHGPLQQWRRKYHPVPEDIFRIRRKQQLLSLLNIRFLLLLHSHPIFCQPLA
jgi:hypothetical protein